MLFSIDARSLSGNSYVSSLEFVSLVLFCTKADARSCCLLPLAWGSYRSASWLVLGLTAFGFETTWSLTLVL